MKINSIHKVIAVVIGIIIVSGGCAKIVPPTGGPKDEQHPLIVKSNPPSHSVNFDKEQINITFDEYIQLKDLNQNLIISPPVDEKPMIRVKGKTLNIKFMSELKDSTTYNIYLGNSLQDYNEGNPIENFQYVLSTGESIDSLSIQGVVLNSFNLMPEEGVFVMLYNEYDDSIPLKRIPDFISKTNEKGEFRINNIRNNNYKLFCLRDANRNYLFDKTTEDIAFIDSLVSFELISHEHVDTIYKNISADTLNPELVIDTIIREPHSFYPVNFFTLMLFKEDKRVQYLGSFNRDKKEKIELTFNKPIKDSINIALKDTVLQTDWYIQENNPTNDTIYYWLTDTSLINKEEISLILQYQKEDSNLVYQWISDTLDLKYFEKKKRGRDNQDNTDTLIAFNLNVQNRKPFDLNKNISFQFGTPTFSIDENKIELIKKVDSIDVMVDYKIVKDSARLRNYNMFVDWAEDTSYTLTIYPNAFTDLYGSANDTTIIDFKTKKMDYYGKLIANINGLDSTFQVIAQLILPGKDSELILSERIVKEDQLIEFPFLEPKEYIFKVVLDKNFNGKWDTGDYLKKIQPEEVLYYDKEIKVRSNWDIEINMNVKKGLEE